MKNNCLNKIAKNIGISILFFTFAVAQTPVSGDQSGLWGVEDSPYQVIGNVTIQTGDTLEIEAGVIVDFTGLYSITINGTLLAFGAINDSIIFKHQTA